MAAPPSLEILGVVDPAHAESRISHVLMMPCVPRSHLTAVTVRPYKTCRTACVLAIADLRWCRHPRAGVARTHARTQETSNVLQAACGCCSRDVGDAGLVSSDPQRRDRQLAPTPARPTASAAWEGQDGLHVVVSCPTNLGRWGSPQGLRPPCDHTSYRTLLDA